MSFLIIVLVIVLSIIVSKIHVPQMIEKELYKELILFSVFMICGVTLAILKSLDIDVNTPADWVKTIYSPLTDRFGHMYK